MTRPRFSSLRLAFAALAGAGLLAAGGLTAPVQADDPDPSEATMTCTGSLDVDYSPGLKTTSQNVALTASGTLNPCISLLGSDFASGTVTASGSGMLGCLAGGNSTGTGTIDWAGPQTSTFSYTGTVALRPLAVTELILDGEITGGTFDGANLTITLTLLTLDLLACTTSTGLTSTSGAAVALMTPP